MKPAHYTASSSNASDDESEGEEEVISTWKVTDPGKIQVVQNAEPAFSKPMSVAQTPAVAESHSRSTAVFSHPAISSAHPNDPVGTQLPAMTQQFQPSLPNSTNAPTKAIWYLGGNHVVRLLTSVDGDLDPEVLSKLAEVPSVVGELALSVESLVSDDFTVGGFEDDLLEKIAANTLAAKRASMSQQVAPAPAEVADVAPAEEAVHHDHSKPSSVPNPLASYQPVPNPLARITPPGSPVPTLNTSNKRKESPTSTTTSTPKAKATRCQLPVPMIKAR
jgi:hypothetical protein